jgi:tRNA (guanine-N(7)-)-methyltransferase subunit TRM82
VDREFRYLITSGEDKMLKIWDLDGLKLLSERYYFLMEIFNSL